MRLNKINSFFGEDKKQYNTVVEIEKDIQKYSD